MKIKQLKLAESIRINPQSEERFFDFSEKFKAYDCYYKEGLVYIIGQDGSCSCTSIANIRQMIPYEHDLTCLGSAKRTYTKIKSQAGDKPPIT